MAKRHNNDTFLFSVKLLCHRTQMYEHAVSKRDVGYLNMYEKPLRFRIKIGISGRFLSTLLFSLSALFDSTIDWV